MAATIFDLPAEIMIQIFGYLPATDIRTLESVCQTFYRIVVLQFWRTHLVELAKYDHQLCQLLEAEGWSRDCENFEMITRLYEKLRDRTRWLQAPKITENVMYKYRPAEGEQVKISSCVLYKDKVFVSLVGGNVQSRSLKSFRLLKILCPAPVNYNVDEPGMLTTPLALHGNTLVVPVRHEDSVFLWNAETEEKTHRLSLPSRSSKIYDVKINATHIVCLASWSLIAWNFSSGTPKYRANVLSVPQVVYDFHDQPPAAGEVNIWFETHNIEMNSSYVVTHASQPLVNAIKSPHGPKSVSFLHCRKLLCGANVIGPSIRPNAAEVEGMEIEKIKLSSSRYNILAIMHMDDSVSTACYTVKIMSIPNGEVLRNIFQTRNLYSEVRMPVQWVDNRLYMKLVPKLAYVDYKYNDFDVHLSMWSLETEEEYEVKDVVMSSLQDMVLVNHAHVVKIFNKFPKSFAVEDTALFYIICGKVYDFWSNGSSADESKSVQS